MNAVMMRTVLEQDHGFTVGDEDFLIFPFVLQFCPINFIIKTSAERRLFLHFPLLTFTTYLSVEFEAVKQGISLWVNARHQQAQKVVIALPGIETNDHNSHTKDLFSNSLYENRSLIF